MSDWVIGIDTHRYTGLVNYRTAYGAGVRFVLSKCGGGYTNTGNPYTDDQWLNNLNNCPSVVPCFGIWWWLTAIASTIVSQANHCADLVKPHKSKFPLGFWLDCECWPGGMQPAANRDMVLRFIDTFEARAGMPVRGIYTSQTHWDPYVAAHPRWATLDLWAARYNSLLAGPWADGRFKFRDWPTWKIWQYSADGNNLGQQFGAPPPPAADYDMDMDRWVGTLESLLVYAGLEEQPLTYEEKVDILWAAHPGLHPEQPAPGTGDPNRV